MNEAAIEIKIYDDYNSCPCCKKTLNKLEEMEKKITMLLDIIQLIQTDQTQMLTKITNTLLRTGVAFPFVHQSRTTNFSSDPLHQMNNLSSPMNK